MTEQELRDNYARAVAARSGTGRGACVEPAAIVALVQRDGPEATRLTTLDHVMSCEECRREFDLLGAIERAGAHETRRAVDRIHWRRYATVAVAASLVLAIGLGPGRRLWEHPANDETMRGARSSEVALLAPDDGTSVTGATVFTWHAFPGARRYTLELLDAGGNVRLSRQAADTSITIDRLDVPAGDYQWMVRTTSDDGIERRSAPRSIRITQQQ